MTNPINQKANKGQGLLETVLVLPVALAFVSILVFAGYRALIFFYVDAALHEAMICTDSAPSSQCENEFEEHIKKVLFKNETVAIALRKNSSGKLSGKAVINPPREKRSSFWQTNITIKKEMKFPLKG